MSVLAKISFSQNRNDDIPNQELAKELAMSNNNAGVKEVAENLRNKNKNIQNDCIKVLYEIGYISPELIADYVMDFLRLLKSKNNRLVWGGMIALAVISEIKAKEIYENLEDIYMAMQVGSVITIDNGVKVLARLSACSDEYNQRIFPYLLDHLRTCRAKEIPQHAESILISVNSQNKEEFIKILKSRENLLTDSQYARVKRIYKKLL